MPRLRPLAVLTVLMCCACDAQGPEADDELDACVPRFSFAAAQTQLAEIELVFHRESFEQLKAEDNQLLAGTARFTRRPAMGAEDTFEGFADGLLEPVRRSSDGSGWQLGLQLGTERHIILSWGEDGPGVRLYEDCGWSHDGPAFACDACDIPALVDGRMQFDLTLVGTEESEALLGLSVDLSVADVSDVPRRWRLAHPCIRGIESRAGPEWFRVRRGGGGWNQRTQAGCRIPCTDSTECDSVDVPVCTLSAEAIVEQVVGPGPGYPASVRVLDFLGLSALCVYDDPAGGSERVWVTYPQSRER